MGRPSQQAEAQLVKPGAPAESYLLQKLEPDSKGPNRQGLRMPLGVVLSDAEIDVIRAWIAEGAKDD